MPVEDNDAKPNGYILWALEQGLPTFGGNNRHGPKTGAGKRHKKTPPKDAPFSDSTICIRTISFLYFGYESTSLIDIDRQRIAEAEYLMNVVGTEVVLFRLLI